jgi:hypothetical protein
MGFLQNTKGVLNMCWRGSKYIGEKPLKRAMYMYYIVSASSRISKGQGYQGFLRIRARSSFGQKRAICVVQGKTDRFSLHLGSIKCFPLSFNTFKTL